MLSSPWLFFWERYHRNQFCFSAPQYFGEDLEVAGSQALRTGVMAGLETNREKSRRLERKTNLEIREVISKKTQQNAHQPAISTDILFSCKYSPNPGLLGTKAGRGRGQGEIAEKEMH